MSKQVRIKRLALVNFKGLRNVSVDFSDTVTTISGRNGTGKTTIKDAFNWLLWGKDSEGNTDSKFGIKTNDANGNFIPDLEHEVTGTFEVVDTDTGALDTLELKRVLVEEWKVPAGETDRVLKGHHTDYFYNGVPLKTKSEYDKKINDIIPEAVFRIITDPYNFLLLHWKAQREMLLQIAGEVSQEDVAKDNEQFATLLANLTGKTVEEYKREIAAKKAKVNERLSKIPTAIDAITRVTPVAPDYAILEVEKGRLEAELTQIDEATASASEANRIAYESAAKVQQEINDRRSRQQKALFNATEEARKNAYATNANYRETERDLKQVISDQQTENQRYSSESARIQADIRRAESTKQGYKNQQDALRAKWFKVNEEKCNEQSGSLICPLFHHCCGDEKAQQQYHADTQAAREWFAQDQLARLNEITEQGKQIGAQIADIDAQISSLQAQQDKLTTDYQTSADALTVKRATLEAVLNTSTKANENPIIKGEDVLEWVELQNEIATLTAQLPTADSTSANDTTALRQRKAELTAQLDEVKRKLNQREVIETNERQINELKDEAATLAQEKANLQTEESIIDDFVNAQMAEVERMVNALFSRVQFKMYRTQIEDAKKVPDCVCYIDGVRFADKNSAGKINAGLDIINTLCSFHGVNAPIFVDNAESINEIIPVESQLIRLVVSTEDFKVEQF